MKRALGPRTGGFYIWKESNENVYVVEVLDAT